jgi:hypothetical protein
MSRPIYLLISLLLLVAPCVAQTAATTTTIETPFTMEKGLIIVEAKIKGDVPVQVVLATGTEHSFTDPGLLQKYKLGAFYTAVGPVNGRNDKTVDLTRVNGVQIGNSKAKDLAMRFGSIAELSKMVGREIFASLGADFFEGQTVQIDFKNHVVRFLEKIPPHLIDSKDPNYNAANATVLQMAPKPSNPFEKRYLVALVKDVQINGQKTNLMFDSSIATLLALSSSTGKKIGLSVPAENADPREDKVTLRFEANEFPDVPVMIYAKGSGADQNLNKSGGAVAGSLFLQRFNAIFDYKKGVVVLERL